MGGGCGGGGLGNNSLLLTLPVDVLQERRMLILCVSVLHNNMNNKGM